MNSNIMFFATSLAISSFMGGCATTGEPNPTHAHANVRADATILVSGIT